MPTFARRIVANWVDAHLGCIARRVWFLGLSLFLVIVLVLPSRIAWAHGGGVPQLTNADAGPYWVSAWTQPDPLRVGQAHITVGVSQPGESETGRREAGAPVLGAEVKVRFEPLDHAGDTFTVPATHEGAANKLLYEADLELPEMGHWHVVITIEGPEGSGSASFATHVSSPRAFNWMWVGGLGLIAVATVWVFQRYREKSDGE